MLCIAKNVKNQDKAALAYLDQFFMISLCLSVSFFLTLSVFLSPLPLSPSLISLADSLASLLFLPFPATPLIYPLSVSSSFSCSHLSPFPTLF